MNTKKMRNKLLFLAITTFSFACTHDEDPLPCRAGKGGEVTIVSYANYGSSAMINYISHQDTAFVKFGTTEYPGNNPANYDMYFISEAGEDHIHCPNLRCGDYYIYRSAWDSINGTTYYGGKGISITQIKGELDMLIQVN